ncbi:translation initiation factor IF-3 [Candidatus Vidania fulgoroideorum]
MYIKLIDNNGKFLGTVDIKVAIYEAKKRNLDLIKLSGKSKQKIYKLGNFKKYLFDKKKKKKKALKSKEIKFKTIICKSDYKVKIKKIFCFLKKKYNVKIIIFFLNKRKRINDDFLNNIIADLNKKFFLNKTLKYNTKNIIINILSSVYKNK